MCDVYLAEYRGGRWGGLRSALTGSGFDSDSESDSGHCAARWSVLRVLAAPPGLGARARVPAVLRLEGAQLRTVMC